VLVHAVPYHHINDSAVMLTRSWLLAGCAWLLCRPSEIQNWGVMIIDIYWGLQAEAGTGCKTPSLIVIS
jgi:hypothetical protein